MTNTPKRDRQISTESQPPKTAGYESVGKRLYFVRPRDLPPLDFRGISTMLFDPGIKLNLAYRRAPIAGVEFAYKTGEDEWTQGVMAERPEVGAFVHRQLTKIWKKFLRKILKAQIWGWSSGEITYKLNRHDQVEIDRFYARHAADTRVQVNDDGEAVGIKVRRVKNRGAVELEFPYCWHHPFQAEDGEYYGNPIMLGGYSPWWDKWCNGGALDVRRLFAHKDAYGGVDMAFPFGETEVEGKGQTSNHDIAREMAEQLETGGITTRPKVYDENGNEMWTLERATIPNNPEHIYNYPKQLDDEIRIGMEIADDVITSDSTGAWAGKRIPLAAFYASLDDWVVEIVDDLDTQCLRHLVEWNFGPGQVYEITHKPLALQAMEQQSNAGPGEPGQPGAQPGGGLMRPGAPQPMTGRAVQSSPAGLLGGPRPQPGQVPNRMSLMEEMATAKAIVRLAAEDKFLKPNGNGAD